MIYLDALFPLLLGTLATLFHAAQGKVDFKYHNYEQMSAVLKDTAKQNPQLTKLYSIGKSVEGRELWVMLITLNPFEERLLVPNVKYVANMHGNEAVGRELMLQLIDHILQKYNSDYLIQSLVNNTRIHVMPSMNPDGFEIAREGECSGVLGRSNARGYDLNRNFPDFFVNNTVKEQAETSAIRRWIDDVQFVLSGNMHGGALVASYPFDNHNISSLFRRNTPSLTPDDDIIRHLAESYSFRHKTMYLGETCREKIGPFVNGTTNGAQWYPLTGGMQDYNYVWAGCVEITFEISCCKYPPSYDLPHYWSDNKEALINYLNQVHQGVKGIVTDYNNNPVPKASMKIQGRHVGFKTSKKGEYWRLLLPGTYTLEVNALGFQPVSVSITITSVNITYQNITLLPVDAYTDYTESAPSDTPRNSYDVTHNNTPQLDRSASNGDMVKGALAVVVVGLFFSLFL